MGRYDYLRSGDASTVTAIGKKIVAFQNTYFIHLMETFSEASPIQALEIGLGQGFFAEACRARSIDYTAIEANPLTARELSARGFKVCSEEVPPISISARFDVIFMNQVFEHVKHVDAASALIDTCCAHLKDKGLLIISSPDFLRWKEDFYHDYSHSYPTTLTRFSQLFFDHGLQLMYRNWYSSFLRGFWLTGAAAFLSRMCHRLGIFRVMFPEKAYKVHCSLLPSVIVVGQKIR
ncbi:hypothetical protein CSB45_10905 [candidate division KSB3 bacterium]|uniref:Methyltransferase n=1 Tax=candidate division KSB3 bacterium TaxID=2044937 RepID=A0A2G6E358_9BACT|nr:MAG: hypothetical protein CSB45_10905 [candidate division KSB3 bacterium]PIE29080.1 MAG: hypothetical protein CSA57_10700 [candidate division KSB3 bacterium]